MPAGDVVFPLESQRLRLSIVLPFAAIGDIRGGVERVLASKLMKYQLALGGVLLSYDGLTMEQQAAKLVDEQPFLKFFVCVNAVVFRPVIGATMTGVVKKIGPDHVGMLVCGLFNASIAERDMNGFYSYDKDGEQWVPAAPGHTPITVGIRLDFTVVGYQEARGLIAVAGALPS